MATPATPTLEANTLNDFVSVRVDQIDMEERLRQVDPIHAEVIGSAMVREGQCTPIVVCRLPGRSAWTLVAGAHRVEGARLKGIEHLKAEEIAPNALLRRQREVSENLWRKDLDPIDRAAFIAELVQLHKLRIGVSPVASSHAIAASARWQKALKTKAEDATATIAVAYGWADSVAEQTGLSPRSIYNDLLLHRLSPSLVARLRDKRHPIATNASQLRALAKLDPEIQEQVVDRLLGANAPLAEVFGGAKAPLTVADALARVRGSNKPNDPEAKRLSAFIGAFQRMGVTEKKGALFQLGGMLPAGHRLVDEAAAPAPQERYRVELIEALSAAFEVLAALDDGSEPVEDDAIASARSKVQLSLMAANSGVIPMPEASDAQ